MKFVYKVTTIPSTASDQTVQDALNAAGDLGFDIVFVGQRAIGKKQVRQPADADLSSAVDHLTEAALTAMQDQAFPGQPYTPDQITDEVKNRIRAIVSAVVGEFPNVA